MLYWFNWYKIAMKCFSAVFLESSSPPDDRNALCMHLWNTFSEEVVYHSTATLFISLPDMTVARKSNICPPPTCEGKIQIGLITWWSHWEIRKGKVHTGLVSGTWWSVIKEMFALHCHVVRAWEIREGEIHTGLVTWSMIEWCVSLLHASLSIILM